MRMAWENRPLCAMYIGPYPKKHLDWSQYFYFSNCAAELKYPYIGLQLRCIMGYVQNGLFPSKKLEAAFDDIKIYAISVQF